MKSWSRVILAVSFMTFLSLSVFVATGLSLDTREDRSTLRGIRGFYVVVENLPPAIEEIGLTQRQVQEDTEQRIRGAGIKVLSKDEWRQEKGGPWLHLNVNIMRVDAGSFVYTYNYSVQLHFRQRVFLARKPGQEVFATTWSKGFLFKSGYIADVRNSIQGVVERFIRIFLSENPELRKSGSKR